MASIASNGEIKLTNVELLSLRGFHLSDDQIRQINDIKHSLHKTAVICFYKDNFERLRRMAVAFLSNNRCLCSVVTYEDLLQQLFVDLLGGLLKLSDNENELRNGIYTCYRYSVVGGLAVLKNVL